MSAELDKNLADTDGLLTRFREDPLPHFINGRADGGRSGSTFDSVTPVDNSVIGAVAAGNAADIDAACRAAEDAFDDWAALSGSARKKILHRVADGIEARARDIALVESVDSGAGDSIHGQGGDPRCRQFSVLCGSRAERARRAVTASRRTSEFYVAPAHRARRCDYALEHTVHVVDLENCTRSGGRLHRRPQARRVVALHRHDVVRDCSRCRSSRRRIELRAGAR